MEKQSLNGTPIANYDKMIANIGKDIRVPGCYCAICGETYALYSYTGSPPPNVDENGVPYYKGCFKCPHQLA